MTTVKSNIWNLEVGNTISFTNNSGRKIEIKVTRIEEKSWYSWKRNSFGTLSDYQKSFSDFKIIKK
jgi:hypothetical protein